MHVKCGSVGIKIHAESHTPLRVAVNLRKWTKKCLVIGATTPAATLLEALHQVH